MATFFEESRCLSIPANRFFPKFACSPWSTIALAAFPLHQSHLLNHPKKCSIFVNSTTFPIPKSSPSSPYLIRRSLFLSSPSA
jgi:hypothetical protein